MLQFVFVTVGSAVVVDATMNCRYDDVMNGGDRTERIVVVALEPDRQQQQHNRRPAAKIVNGNPDCRVVCSTVDLSMHLPVYSTLFATRTAT